jgi:hypothetical protein
MGVTLNSDGTIRSYHDETVDEARISGTVRSADWIKTEYNNQYSPSTFYSVAAEEGSGPALSGHSVLRNAIIRNAVVN